MFGGTKLKPDFGNSEILLGKREQKTFTFNEVGSLGNDGKRRVSKDEVLSFSLNGREYVVQSKVDGLSTESIASRLKDLINNDAELLSDSLSFETSEYTSNVDALGTLRLLNAVRSANLESSIASEVEFDPVPAITGIFPLHSLTATSIIFLCSSWDNVGDSPVVPPGTIPFVPFFK